MTRHATSGPNSDGAHIPDSPRDVVDAKRALRRTLLAARRALTADTLIESEQACLERLRALPECACAATVAAYVSMGDEPGTGLLLDWLAGRGTRVLLPVLLPDNDLEWAEYRGPADLTAARRGLQEPTGPRLGPEAIAEADLAVLPGLAVDRQGHRMGRGGGSYDRALARLGPATTTVLLLHEGELRQPVPTEPHDRTVDVALTPTEVLRFR